MKRAEIITRMQWVYQELQADPTEVIVGYGAAMVLLGLRKETSDIDLDLPPEIYEKWCGSHSGWEEKEGMTGLHIDIAEDVSIHMGTPDRIWIVDDIRIYHPDSLLWAYRHFLGHPKRDPKKTTQDAQNIVDLTEWMKRGTSLHSVDAKEYSVDELERLVKKWANELLDMRPLPSVIWYSQYNCRISNDCTAVSVYHGRHHLFTVTRVDEEGAQLTFLKLATNLAKNHAAFMAIIDV
jgi:hypothetical protein